MQNLHMFVPIGGFILIAIRQDLRRWRGETVNIEC